LGSPSAENPCIAARLGLKLRRGWGAVRHAPGVGGGRLRTNPLNLAGLARCRESVISASIVVPSHRPKTIVIGAGVVGLGIAWRLAQAGCQVTVYDRGEAGHGATWAAAGMLAAAVETEPGEEPLLPLALESQRLWPDFARELEGVSGISVNYRDEGTMVVALNRDDTAQLRHSYEFQKGLGLDLHWLTAAEARSREPHLKPGIAAAVLSPRDHQVENRLLGQALAVAAKRAGVELIEHCPVREITIDGGHASGVVAGRGHDPGDAVVLAAGARSRQVGGHPPALPPRGRQRQRATRPPPT